MRCPKCGGTFDMASFCPRDGSKLLADPEPELLGGRYRILRKIGEGGMGEVFQAEHAFTHRKVAVKRLKHAVMADPSASVRLQREAQFATDIDHPNIVDVLDFGHDADGRVFLVMEWLDGETLDDRLQRGRIEIDLALEIATQTCEGLTEAHARGIVHRDLKPANLFLVTDRQGRIQVKVLDFGIATMGLASSKLTGTGMLVGTPFYMSPEQANGEQVDARTDVYSLGVILYEMLAGTPPFRGDSAMAVLHQITTKAPEPLASRAPDRSIPPAIADAVVRCLAKHPADRYGSMTELVRALGIRSPTLSVSIVKQAVIPMVVEVDALETVERKRRWPWLVVAMLVVGGGALLVVVLAPREDRPASGAVVVVDASVAVVADAAAAGDAPVSPDAKDVRQITGRADHFEFVVSISPVQPGPDQPFEIEIELRDLPPRLAAAIASGKLVARLSLRDAAGRAPLFDARHPVEAGAHAHFVTSLHAVTRLRADLELWVDGRELEHARFELFAP